MHGLWRSFLPFHSTWLSSRQHHSKVQWSRKLSLQNSGGLMLFKIRVFRMFFKYLVIITVDIANVIFHFIDKFANKTVSVLLIIKKAVLKGAWIYITLVFGKRISEEAKFLIYRIFKTILMLRFSVMTGGRHLISFYRPTTSLNSLEEFARPRARAHASSASTNRQSPSRTSSVPSSTKLLPWDGSSLFLREKEPESESPLSDLVCSSLLWYCFRKW